MQILYIKIKDSATGVFLSQAANFHIVFMSINFNGICKYIAITVGYRSSCVFRITAVYSDYKYARVSFLNYSFPNGYSFSAFIGFKHHSFPNIYVHIPFDEG